MQISGANYASGSDKWVTGAVHTAAVLTGAAKTAAVSTDNDMVTDDETDTVVTGVAASSKSEVSKKTAEKPKEQEVTKDKSFEEDSTMLSFKVHKGTGEIMVRIIDNNTGEVIREIPPEKILDSIAAILKNAGINVDKKV